MRTPVRPGSFPRFPFVRWVCNRCGGGGPCLRVQLPSGFAPHFEMPAPCVPRWAGPQRHGRRRCLWQVWRAARSRTPARALCSLSLLQRCRSLPSLGHPPLSFIGRGLAKTGFGFSSPNKHYPLPNVCEPGAWPGGSIAAPCDRLSGPGSGRRSLRGVAVRPCLGSLLLLSFYMLNSSPRAQLPPSPPDMCAVSGVVLSHPSGSL